MALRYTLTDVHPEDPGTRYVLMADSQRLGFVARNPGESTYVATALRILPSGSSLQRFKPAIISLEDARDWLLITLEFDDFATARELPPGELLSPITATELDLVEVRRALVKAITGKPVSSADIEPSGRLADTLLPVVDAFTRPFQRRAADLELRIHRALELAENRSGGDDARVIHQMVVALLRSDSGQVV